MGRPFPMVDRSQLFANIYNKNLDKAIPVLIEEMSASKGRAA